MSQKPQMLILDPKDELRFYPPYNAESTCTLEVTNPTPYSILYKIKTTASFRYYVTPKMGLLMPYSQEVVVIGMKAPRGNTEDKFKLVAFVSPNTGESAVELWKRFDETKAMASKLMVVFENTATNSSASVKRFPKKPFPNKEELAARSLTKCLAFAVVGVGAAASWYYWLANTILLSSSG